MKSPGFVVTAVMALALALMGLSATAAANTKPAAEAEAATPDAAPDLSLPAVLQALQQQYEQDQQQLKAREAHYRQRLRSAEKSKQLALQRVAELEAEGLALEGQFEANRLELLEKDALLKEKIGALKELFGLFQQNASDLIGAFVESPTSLQLPNRDIWLQGFANRMKNAAEVTSSDDIRQLWQQMLQEISALSQVVAYTANVVDGENDSAANQTVVRIGGFNLISDAGYLQWRVGQQVAATMQQPVGPYQGQIQQYLAATSHLTTLSVDPSGGDLVALLAAAPSKTDRINQGGLVGYIILALGAAALLLATFKLFDISSISAAVKRQRERLSQPQNNNGLGRLQLAYQRFSQLDAENLEMKLHELLAAETQRVNRFSVFLAIIAAVAPLLGLLGTVVGMINTFQAITLYGTGDPQTMAGGISQALITTVLGLLVAVPAVLLHAWVNARGRVVSNIYQQQLAVLLGDRSESAHQQTVVPS